MKYLVLILALLFVAVAIWAYVATEQAKAVTAEVEQYIKDHPL